MITKVNTVVVFEHHAKAKYGGRGRKYISTSSYLHLCGSVSVAGIATGYGLDSPGIESRWGRDFPHL